MSGIGMMDAAFFVGKNELLSWLNELLQLNYTKVEQCANGAAYCQIMDAIYPVRLGERAQRPCPLPRWLHDRTCLWKALHSLHTRVPLDGRRAAARRTARWLPRGVLCATHTTTWHRMVSVRQDALRCWVFAIACTGVP
jgi:hypothetical protein